MTELCRYVLAPNGPRLIERSDDPGRINAALAPLNVGFERWTAASELGVHADADFILNAYARDIDALKRRAGYQSADVVRMTPDHPDRDAMRAKFLSEHVHDDDEVRFFVEGTGAFYLRDDDRVLRITCMRDDLLSVPKGLRHWFDMGPAPAFCAIRLFTTPDGWVARFTGDKVAESVPGFGQ